MTDGRIRVVALGILRRPGGDGNVDDVTGGEEILVSEHYDPDPGPRNPNRFYRPLGGGVEFGEHSESALPREFDEELSVSVTAIDPIGTYEDVFTFHGTNCHEVRRVYEVDVADDWVYERDRFVGYEPDLDERIDCLWKPVADFRDGEDTLYPEQVLEDL